MKTEMVKDALDTYAAEHMVSRPTLWPAVQARIVADKSQTSLRPTLLWRAFSRTHADGRRALAPARLGFAGASLVSVLLLAFIASVSVWSAPVSTQLGFQNYTLVAHADTLDPAQMEQARQVLETRLHTLGQQAAQVEVHQNSLTVHLPLASAADAVVKRIAQTGRVEFVATGSVEVPVGTHISTSYCVTGSLYQPGTHLCAQPSPRASGTLYQTVLTGDQLDRQVSQMQVTPDGAFGVVFRVRPNAVATMTTFTHPNLGQYMAITLDGQVVSSAVLNGEIHDLGEITLATDATEADAQTLVMVLKSGSLPVTLTVAGSATPKA